MNFDSRLRTFASVASLLLAACSSSSAGDTPPDDGAHDAPGPDGDASTGADAPDASDASTAGYDVAYVADAAGLHVGKSHFQLKITSKVDGSPATGLASSIVLKPTMAMSMMSHGNPVPIDAVSESATPGTYDCTLFFTMASVDTSGNPAGQWKLGVGIDTFDAATIDLTVNPPVGTDTPVVMLKNAADTITNGSMTKARSYPVFRDSLVAASTDYTFQAFLATQQEGLMVWPPVTVGLKLVDANGNVQVSVDTLELEASTDASTWVPMTCGANARCAATLPGLSSGVAGKVYVKMKIDGRDYTTDGAAADPAKNNGYATFSVTPG